jgi:hypothetical protein
MAPNIPAIVTGTVLSIVGCISLCCCFKSQVDRMGAPTYTGADYVHERMQRQTEAMNEAWGRAEQPSSAASNTGSLSIPGNGTLILANVLPLQAPAASLSRSGLESIREPSSGISVYYSARSHLSSYPSM